MTDTREFIRKFKTHLLTPACVSIFAKLIIFNVSFRNIADWFDVKHKAMNVITTSIYMYQSCIYLFKHSFEVLYRDKFLFYKYLIEKFHIILREAHVSIVFGLRRADCPSFHLDKSRSQWFIVWVCVRVLTIVFMISWRLRRFALKTTSSPTTAKPLRMCIKKRRRVCNTFNS